MNRPETGKKSRVAREASSQYFVLRVQQVGEEMEPLCSAARFNKPLPADAQTGDVSDQSRGVSDQSGIVSDQSGSVSDQSGIVSDQSGGVSDQSTNQSTASVKTTLCQRTALDC